MKRLVLVLFCILISHQTVYSQTAQPSVSEPLKTISLDGKEMRYGVYGSGKKGIILLHGLAGDHNVWTKTIEHFKTNYKVIAVDLYGNGESDKNVDPQFAFRSMPEIIGLLIKKEELSRAVLVGHSISGSILWLAAKDKTRGIGGLVFVDCVFNTTDDMINKRNSFADSMLSKKDVPAETKKWFKKMIADGSKKDQKLILSALDKLNNGWIFHFLKAANFRQEPVSVKYPVLIFETTPFTEEPQYSFKNAFSNGEVVNVGDKSHFFFVFQSDLFNEHLEQFLSSIKW